MLQTTRQAAFQRFGRPVDPRSGTAMSRQTLPGAPDIAVAIFAAMSDGNFERMGEPVAYPIGEHTAVDIPLHFEAGDRTGRVTLDSEGNVIGLFIRPAAQ